MEHIFWGIFLIGALYRRGVLKSCDVIQIYIIKVG